MRIRLDSAPDGRMVYGYEVPARARSVLRVAAGAYDEVELRDPSEVDLGGLASIDVAAGGQEGSGDEPLGEDGEDHPQGDGGDADELFDSAESAELAEASPWSDLRRRRRGAH